MTDYDFQFLINSHKFEKTTKMNRYTLDFFRKLLEQAKRKVD